MVWLARPGGVGGNDQGRPRRGDMGTGTGTGMGMGMGTGVGRAAFACVVRAAAGAVLAGAATVVAVAQAAGAAADARRSGTVEMSPALQAMQRDDLANPAWLLLQEGERRFGAECARCHSLASMAGVAARHPAVDARSGRVTTLSRRVADCRARHVDATALAPDDSIRLALELAVAQRSRGWPIAPPADARLAPMRERGRALFGQRLGQLDLSCAMCHDRFAGQRLGGSRIPQGHPTGYPIYRLEWQAVGSLQRRLRACFNGVRAEVPADDDDDLTALEAWLMQRAAGMPMEAPAIRP